MKRFLRYRAKIQQRREFTKTQFSLAAFGILLLLFLTPTLTNHLLNKQQVLSSHTKVSTALSPSPPLPSQTLLQTATINAAPASASVTTGTPLTVDVVVNGGGQAFNAAQATVTVSANLAITVLTSPATNACRFTYVQTPTWTNPSFAGAILASSATNCTVYTLTLTPLSAGTGTMTFTNGSVKAYSNNAEMLQGVQNGSYTLVAPTPTPTPLGNGLQAVYYNNKDFTGSTVSRIDPTISFNWGTGAPVTGIDPSTFSVVWTGSVIPQYTQTYTFSTRTDDGVRLFVNGQQLINHWSDQSATEYSGTLQLSAGRKYPIRMEYYQNLGQAVAQLRWSSSSQGKQIIPQSRLYGY